MKRFNTLCLFIGGSALIWGMVLGGSIITFATVTQNPVSDVAIVLGAKAFKNAPSPVFRERINHAITLYRQKIVSKIILTGGADHKTGHIESKVAFQYAREKGVAPYDMLIETLSATTFENLSEAKKIMTTHRFKTAIIVSDPLHMRRAVTMARNMGIKAFSSPTPTFRYRSFVKRIPFFFREMYFYNRYLINGV